MNADLIDTSAWVEYLRGTGSPAHLEVRRLLFEPGSAVVTTQPVAMELLAGATSPQALRKLEMLTNGLQLVSVDAHVDFQAAAAIYRLVRHSGHTVRKLLDCLIAAVAARAGATLVHRHVDFEAIAECLPALQSRSLR